MVKHIDDTEFDRIMQDKDASYVIDFWAEWCGYCKMLAPIYESVSEQFPDVTFCKINTDEYMEPALRMKVSGLPTIIFINHGNVVAKNAGFMDEDELTEFIEENK